MKSLAVSMTSAVALALSACGGASQPAETPTTAGTGTQTGGGAGATAPAAMPESPASPDVEAGNKAFDAGNFDQARTSFETAAKKNPKDFGALYNLGQTCEKLGDRPCAEKSYKAAIAVNPGLDVAAASLANLLVDAARVDDALAVAKQGLISHPGSGPLHEALGLAMATQGQQDPATQEFEQAIKISPQDPLFHLTFAHWLNVWHVRGSVPHLDTALELTKDDVPFLLSIGLEYRLAAAPDACIKTFDRAIQLKDGGEGRTGRALCKLALKDQKGALDDLQAAVRVEPNYPTEHYYLAGRLAVMKRFKEAAVEYQSYLSLAPEGSLVPAATEKLKLVQDAMKKK
jgi:tetratricopeptide (TPR) repeat protein